jgi:hypothetical protein
VSARKPPISGWPSASGETRISAIKANISSSERYLPTATLKARLIVLDLSRIFLPWSCSPTRDSKLDHPRVLLDKRPHQALQVRRADVKSPSFKRGAFHGQTCQVDFFLLQGLVTIIDVVFVTPLERASILTAVFLVTLAAVIGLGRAVVAPAGTVTTVPLAMGNGLGASGLTLMPPAGAGPGGMAMVFLCGPAGDGEGRRGLEPGMLSLLKRGGSALKEAESLHADKSEAIAQSCMPWLG